MEIMVWIVAKPSWNQQRILHCSFTFVQGFFFPFLVSMKRHFLFELVYLHDYSIRVLLTYKILVTAINAILVISSRWLMLIYLFIRYNVYIYIYITCQFHNFQFLTSSHKWPLPCLLQFPTHSITHLGLKTCHSRLHN